MKSWFALVFAPTTALAAQSILYALVTPSCAHQSRLWLHGTAAGALLFTLLLVALARGDWNQRSRLGATPDHDGGDAAAPRRFLAIVATAVAALSCLVIAAMWFNLWVLSPCDP